MKKGWLFIWICAVLCALSCEKERTAAVCVPEGEPVELVIPFGYGGPPQLTVDTRSTLGEEPENMVYNLYVFIFDMGNNGKKLFGHYFDYRNLSNSGASTLANWWEVDNNVQNEVTGALETRGTIHIHTTSKPNCRIVAVSNIDAEMVNISPEQLSTVEKYADIYDQKAKLNQLITSRSGYFPMTGEIPSVNTGDPSWGTLVLKRLDAKIKFRVYVDLSVQTDGVTPVSRIADFKPLKWQVVNLPRRAYVLERGEYAEGHLTPAQQAALQDAAGSDDDDYFDQGETNFETEDLTVFNYSGTSQYKKFIHGFSFYMMENRKPLKNPSAPPGCYADRELQEKQNPTIKAGIATVKNGSFVHPDDKSTYVIITARVKMDNVTYGASEGATLSGDVQYIVHLGDFSGGKWEDFNVFRNHAYTYDIIINDVGDVRLEVNNNYDGNTLAEKLAEPEPGASGKVSVALEEIFTCDAHYSSHVVPFHAKNIDAEHVSWVVETPFNPSGAGPVVTNGVEITTGIDHEWVEFRVNQLDENGCYLANREVYKPRTGAQADGKTWNITQLVAFLRDEKDKMDHGKANAFDNTPEEEGGPVIRVTAFVNEFYYEKNPITGDYQKDLWKRFVNQPMRYMHILSETKTAADGESQVIGASFTIQQKSIQTIYNIANPELESAWGCEHENDVLERGNRKYDNTSGSNRGNNSLTNGRLNTLKEWTLVSPNGNNRILGDFTNDEAYWEHYLNLTATNQESLLLPNYQYLRYGCMTRNRDNDGDGVISQDEVRWYMAATNQLLGLYLGSYGIESDARLYQRNVQERADPTNEIWRQHLISSTQYGTNSSSAPRVVWAEEGFSGTDPNASRQWSSLDLYDIRCVRNLGYDPATDGDFTYADYKTEPTFYMEMTRLRNGVPYSGSYDENVYYEFDCSRINEASLRYYTNRELVEHDEDGEQACLYKRFTFAPKKDAVIIADVPEIKGKNTIDKINNYVNENIGMNPYCPPGYRIPNAREISILRNFIPSGDVTSYFIQGDVFAVTRTYWSFGIKPGRHYDAQRKYVNDKYGWAASHSKVLVLEKSKGTPQVRCVKDIKVD